MIYLFEKINLDTITTDNERAIINSINKIFKYKNHILCYFNLKHNMVKKAGEDGLNKEKFLEDIKSVISKIGDIPFYYKDI